RVEEVLARLTAHVRNARAVRIARQAVDVAGLGVLVVDALGRVAWRSPRAGECLGQFGIDPAAATADWLGDPAGLTADPAADARLLREQGD
ncbi:hypothetical protein ABTP22_19125, partial [Acinetobacter baumannii]